MLSLLNNALPINEQKYHHLNFLDHRKEVIRVINYDFTFKYTITSKGNNSRQLSRKLCCLIPFVVLLRGAA